MNSAHKKPNNILCHNNISNPYYIYAPSYSNASAGIKVLHFLCHHLNLKGYPAFLITSERCNYTTNPHLITPIATEETADFHKRNGKVPIIIYPDVISGNPINGQCVVRYLLNYAGLLGGDKKFSDQDLIFTYTRKIGQKLGIENPQVLFMPICDTDIFYPATDKIKRSGSCFYASKYRNFPGTQLSEITKNSIEITRHRPDSQTTQEVAELLRKSELFYSYEDTSLITEAILCGCPVVLIKNEFFQEEPLAQYELGTLGYTYESDPESIQKAKDSISLAQQQFFDSIDKFWSHLDNFITTTQNHSKKITNPVCEIKITARHPKKKPLGRKLRSSLRSYLKLIKHLSLST